jgi:hypothetical protein
VHLWLYLKERFLPRALLTAATHPRGWPHEIALLPLIRPSRLKIHRIRLFSDVGRKGCWDNCAVAALLNMSPDASHCVYVRMAPRMPEIFDSA